MISHLSRRTWIAVIASGSILALAGCGSALSNEQLRDAAGARVVSGTTGTTGPAADTTTGTSTTTGSMTTASQGGVSKSHGSGDSASTSTGGSTSTGVTGGSSTTGGSTTTGSKGSTTTSGGSQGNQSEGSTSTGPATGTPINIGQIGEFSGIAGAAEGPGQVGMQVWAKYVNAHGGVAGHPINLISVDDGGDAAKGQSEFASLVQSHHIVALVGAFLALSFNGIAPYAEAHHVPVIGGDTVNPGWFTNKYFFPASTSQDTINLGEVRQAVLDGTKKVAMFYCIELPECGSDVQELRNGGAKKEGADLVYTAQVSVTTLDFQTQCTAAKQAGANAIYIIGDEGMVSRMGRDCVQVGEKVKFFAPGIGISTQQETDPNLQTLHTVAFNDPWVDTTTPAAKIYQSALATYAPGAITTGSTMQAWASGQLFAQAVEHIPANEPITSANIITALHAVSGTTLDGLAPPLIFPKNAPAKPSNCYYVAQVINSKWVATQGNKLSCLK